MTAFTVAQERRRRGPKRQHRPFAVEDLERLLPGRCSVERAEVLGIQYRQLLRLRRSGLTMREADELAVAGGFHPGEVWSMW